VLVGVNPNNFLKITAALSFWHVLEKQPIPLTNRVLQSKVAIVKALIFSFALGLIVLLAPAPATAQTRSEGRRAPLDEALELSQDLSGKTVIRLPNLPALSEFNNPIPSSDTNGMRVVLENELLQRGIELVPLREAFVLAVESGWKDSPAANYIATIKPRPTQASPFAALVPDANDQTPGQEAIPPGTIDLRAAQMSQVLDLYGTLLHRNILRSSQIISSGFNLRTQTPITKNDAIYLLEVVLALNGFASVDDGTNFVQVVPLKQISHIMLRAPQPDPSEPLIERDDIQQFGGEVFIPGKRPKPLRAAANDVVAYYGELTGRTTVPSEQAGRQFVLFRVQTRLTKPELLYALETTLGLNGLAIIEVDDKTVRAGYIHEREKGEKKS